MNSIEADFAAPTAPPANTQSFDVIPAKGGTVTTADFELAEPAMPAKVTDVDPLHALSEPGTGFPPLPANSSGRAQQAVATVSDGDVGAVRPVGYNRPNEAVRLPPNSPNRATRRSGEAFSSDAAPAGSTSVSDSSPSSSPAKTPLHWGR
jgi:hypothetical protein